VREGNPVHEEWLLAILVAQEKGDLAPLAQLLRHKEFDLGRGERVILAALFDRFRLAKKRGAQRTPIGKLSEGDKLEIMAEQVRDIQAGHVAFFGEDHRPMSRQEAIEKVSGFYGINADKLRDFLDGKRADARPRGRKRTTRT
jgi:hypothetical protein